MVYCQNDQHWPWFIATVINRTLSEFFFQTKQIFVPWLLVFVLSFISSLKGISCIFHSLQLLHICLYFTSTRKRSQLFFIRLRSFTFPPSLLLPSLSLPSPPLHSRPSSPPSNKSSRPASIILLSEVLHFVSTFLQATWRVNAFFFQTFRKVNEVQANISFFLLYWAEWRRKVYLVEYEVSKIVVSF